MSERRKAAQKAMFGGGGLDSSEGLYTIANTVGLGKEADRALDPYTGESKKYFSGGFVSDAMDVLSTIDYGITGILKGQGFVKGIENRSSFADDDALGSYGVAGKTAGIVADIALGVATSFIPIFGAAKFAAKVTGVSKLASAASKRVVGELKPISLSGGDDVVRVGGLDIVNDTLAKFLPNWSYDQRIKKKLLDADAESVNLQQKAYKLYHDFDKVDDNVINNIATRDADGRIIRKSPSEILRDFKEGQGLEQALGVTKGIDDLMNILVTKGGLSKDVAEEQFGKYLTQSYDEIILAKAERPKGRIFGSGQKKGRNYDLTEEKMKELGQVEDMKLVLPNTMNKIISLIHETELGNILERSALTMDDVRKIEAAGGRMADLTTADSLAMYKSGVGKEVELKTRISEVSKMMKPILKDLRKGLEGDELAKKELAALEKRLSNVKQINLNSYSELMSDVRNVLLMSDDVTPASKSLRNITTTETAARKVDIDPIFDRAKKYKSVEDFVIDITNEEFGVSKPLDELFSSLNKTGLSSGGKLDFDAKEVLAELGIKRGKEAGDVTDVLSYDKLKRGVLADTLERNIRYTYNYFARKNDLPFAQSVSLGKGPDNIFKVMNISVEDGLPDMEILNLSSRIVKDIADYGSIIKKQEVDEVPLLRKRETELEDIWKKANTQTKPTTETKTVVAKLSEGQQLLHGKVAKYIKSQPGIMEATAKGIANAPLDEGELFQKFIRTTEGKELSRAFKDGKMQGFDSPYDFWTRVVADEGYKTVSPLKGLSNFTAKEYKEANRKLLSQTGREYSNVAGKIKLKKEEHAAILSKVVDNEQLLSDLAFTKDELREKLFEVQSRRLKGKFINRHVAEMVESLTSTKKEAGEMLVQRFKKANVVWNPAAIVRNGVSATIQNWWKTGLGPWNATVYYNAVKILNEGTNNHVYREMVEHGFARGQGGLQEIVSQAFNERAAAQAGIVTGKKGTHVLHKMGILLEHAYGYSDDVAKIAAYTHGRANGLDADTAMRRALAATFNYSDVTPLVRRMRTAIWGVPFLTFAIKSAPLVASTAVHARHRITVFQKIKEGMYNMAGVEGEEEREVLPDYMKEGVFIKMPFKNEDGSSAYFDMSYIIPFGALVDGSWVKDPISANIVTQFVREMSTNKTFSGHTIFREGAPVEENIAMLSTQVVQRFIPKYLQTEINIDGYNADGTLRVSGLGGKIKNNLTQEEYQSYEFGNLLAKNLAMKFQKFDQETAAGRQEWAKKEALERVLIDNGVLREFTKAYLPKDSELRPENAPGMPVNLYDKEVRTYR